MDVGYVTEVMGGPEVVDLVAEEEMERRVADWSKTMHLLWAEDGYGQAHGEWGRVP